MGQEERANTLPTFRPRPEAGAVATGQGRPGPGAWGDVAGASWDHQGQLSTQPGGVQVRSFQNQVTNKTSVCLHSHTQDSVLGGWATRAACGWGWGEALSSSCAGTSCGEGAHGEPLSPLQPGHPYPCLSQSQFLPATHSHLTPICSCLPATGPFHRLVSSQRHLPSSV